MPPVATAGPFDDSHGSYLSRSSQRLSAHRWLRVLPAVDLASRRCCSPTRLVSQGELVVVGLWTLAPFQLAATFLVCGVFWLCRFFGGRCCFPGMQGFLATLLSWYAGLSGDASFLVFRGFWRCCFPGIQWFLATLLSWYAGVPGLLLSHVMRRRWQLPS